MKLRDRLREFDDTVFAGAIVVAAWAFAPVLRAVGGEVGKLLRRVLVGPGRAGEKR